MTLKTAPIVGMHFRPPAKQVIAALPSGADLALVPDPENPYDTDAVGVWCDPRQIPEGDARVNLGIMLQGTGHDLDEVCALDKLMLGYIANSDKTGGKFASGLKAGPLGTAEQIEAKLMLDEDGKPKAAWEE